MTSFTYDDAVNCINATVSGVAMTNAEANLRIFDFLA